VSEIYDILSDSVVDFSSVIS